MENLSSDDDGHSSDWHSEECELAGGDQTENVLIGQRRSDSPHSPITGLEDVSSAMSQSTSTRQNPASHTSAATNRPKVHADPATDTNRRTSSDIFPCRNPINPHMRSVETRLQTFADRASYWPAHHINATPRDIANAGFYYLGE